MSHIKAEVGDVFLKNGRDLILVIEDTNYLGTKIIHLTRYGNKSLMLDGYSNPDSCARQNKYLGNISDIFVSMLDTIK